MNFLTEQRYTVLYGTACSVAYITNLVSLKCVASDDVKRWRLQKNFDRFDVFKSQSNVQWRLLRYRLGHTKKCNQLV